MTRHEYTCLAHGKFFYWKEQIDPVPPACPHGCSEAMIHQVFSAPAFLSQTTKNHDAMTQMQAQAMGLTDMSNAQGRTVAENNARKSWGKDADPFSKKSYWQQADKGALASAQNNGLADAKQVSALTEPKPQLVAPNYG